MADFYVPRATNLLGSLDTTIAKGPDLSWIGNLPDSYWAGQQQAFRQRDQDLFHVNINLRKWKYWCAVGITVGTACTCDSSYSTLCSGFTSKGD